MFQLHKRSHETNENFIQNSTKDAEFIYESFRNKTNRVIWNFFFFTKQIHEANLSKMNPRNESFKKGLWNEFTKQIFLNQYGFANPKPRIPKDLGLFKVLLCTKDSSGFVRIRWFRENRSNLLKLSLRNESTKQIFWKH
jgi:hypothetical protein